MSMHQGLDLSKFKKVSSDKQSSTLRHAKGHEIKIAHKGISPKMREALDGLPMHLAEGGEVDDDPSQGASAEVAGNDDPSAPVATAEDAGDDGEDSAPEAPSEAPAPAPVAPVAAAPQPAAPQPQAAPPPAQPPAPPPPTVSQELKQEGDMYRQDLSLGHIKPETYQDLFAKKDTLGKIGTLFGLLLSGAGSGLAGQSNAVMDMMNKEISNDLEAQKASQSGAQNIYQLNLTHQKQLADIKNQQIQQQLAIAKTPAEIQELESQAKHLGVEAQTKAAAATRIQMNWNALHSLTENMKKIPPTIPDGRPNPMYTEAQQKLMMLYQGVQSENYNIADRAEAASALGKAVLGAGSGQGGEQDFQNNQTVLRVSGQAPIADDKASRHIPGIPGQASIPLNSQDREKILSGQQFQSSLQRFIDWTKKHSGDLNPKDKGEGEALAAQMQGAYRMASYGGVYKEGEQGFISKLIDSEPTKFFNEIRVLPKLKAVQNESKAQLDQLLKSKGFQGYTEAKAQPQSSGGGLREGQTGTTKSGQPVIVKNGKWVSQAKVSKK